MAAPAELIPRHAEAFVRRAMTDTRVVALTGARQAGKSTIARRVIADLGGVEQRLDNPAVLARAKSDPVAFVRQATPLLIDEIQRAPELLLAIKEVVDLDPTPGRFLLTGSARMLAMRTIPDSLVGRIEYIELAPLAQSEIERANVGFVEWAFAGAHRAAWVHGSESKHGYFERVARGGFPDAVHRSDHGARRRFFRSYAQGLARRDVRDLSQIEHPDDLERLIGVLASRMSAPLAVDALAGSMRLPETTLRRYLSLLEQLYTIKRIPAWSTNMTKRATRQAKLAFVDSGLAAHLARHDARRMLESGRTAGALLESFVLMELDRQLQFLDFDVRLHHYRTRDGLEVDAILEASDGEIVAVEVKASSTLSRTDARGLLHLAERLDNRLAAGIVLYTGSTTVPLGNRLWALPIDALWRDPG